MAICDIMLLEVKKMYLNKQKKSDGDIYLSIREKYHVPKIGARERVIEPIGNLSVLKEQYDDPIAFFTQRAKDLTEEKKAEKRRSDMLSFGETLARARKALRLTQKDVAALMKEKYGLDVKSGSISHWEKEEAVPNARQFLYLCEIYKVQNINETFGVFDESNPLSRLNSAPVKIPELFAAIPPVTGQADILHLVDTVVPDLL